MKKKALLSIAAAGLIVACSATAAFAAYADADGDGICDNATTCTQPLDGTGKQAGHRNAGAGCNYADADGDGICDNATTCTQPLDSTGKQAGHGKSQK